MAYQVPKRILEDGAEIQIDKINNTCRRRTLDIVKSVLKDEYEEVMQDPVFGPILAILDNKLMYSGKIIHSFICKQLKECPSTSFGRFPQTRISIDVHFRTKT
ncbi:hypothetical protein Bca101_044149 [Brassica carinata]